MEKFNPLIANNNLALLPPNVDLSDKDFLLSAYKTKNVIAELKTRLTLNKRSIANTLDLLSPLFVPEAVASSGVENIITTNEGVYLARIKEERELTPSEKEAVNYTDALMLGAQILNKKQFLATNDYIKIQAVLEPSKMGLRNAPGTVLSNPATKKVYYTPPDNEKVIRDKLQNFENYFNERPEEYEIYARAAILHYQFEAIHPFWDGNGRTGRILMPLYLTLQKELPVPILFISQYILKHRDDYYQKLRAVTEKGEWKEWILYIMAAIREQAKYTCGILEKIQSNIREVKGIIKAEYAFMYSSELLDFLFSNAYFTEKQFEGELKIAYNTANKYLDILEKANIVERKKQEGRNRFLYVTKKYIEVLNNI
jgi:Fic family protein